MYSDSVIVYPVKKKSFNKIDFLQKYTQRGGRSYSFIKTMSLNAKKKF